MAILLREIFPPHPPQNAFGLYLVRAARLCKIIEKKNGASLFYLLGAINATSVLCRFVAARHS